ncbi:hypothetical protein D3C73_1176950 [compost metagenome]
MVQGDLALLQLRLLHAEYISVRLAKIIVKSFIHTCSQSIDVPGYQLHSFISSSVCLCIINLAMLQSVIFMERQFAFFMIQ